MTYLLRFENLFSFITAGVQEPIDGYINKSPVLPPRDFFHFLVQGDQAISDTCISTRAELSGAICARGGF